MTVYDLIQMYANKSEKEQRQAFVCSIWDIEDVDAVLDAMGYDDCLGNNDKIACLAQAVEDGDTDDDEIGNRLWNNLQKVLDGGSRSMEDDDEPDPDEYDEGHAEEWMERHPYGWHNSESDYGTGDEEEHENGTDGDDDLQK